MINFPYGVSDFHRIRHDNYLYIDRTDMIPELEQAGRQLVFLRPRRFGKSLLLSMLENYYDINKVDEFAALFGDLAIGGNPTAEHNQYLILHWDFSQVSSQGKAEQVKQALYSHINEAAKYFNEYYREQLAHPADISEDGFATFKSLVSTTKNSGHQLYILIDEYDNFANEILMNNDGGKTRYFDLLEGEGVVKTLFKIIKGSASEGKVSRVFITGVAPLALSDVTSGYNVATSIFLEPRFNALCGITQLELEGLLTQTLASCGNKHLSKHATILATLRQYYNGYRFCKKRDQPLVYNPTLCFYFLRHYQRECETPDQLLDANLATDAGRIRYIAQLPKGAKVLEQIMDKENPPTIPYLENQFGIEQLDRLQNDNRYMISLMYFFGILTIIDIVALGELQMGVPNKVIEALYVKQLLLQALPNPSDQQSVDQLAKQFYQSADLTPLANYMEDKFFAVFNNRDYRWSNELTVKTTFLTLLFNDLWYIMDSELGVKRRYSDLVMTIRPSMRKHETLKDIILEFKYLSLKAIGMTGQELSEQSREDLLKLPLVQEQLNDAEAQLKSYQEAFVERSQEPERLRCIAVVSLGFERVVWRNIVLSFSL